MVGGVDDDAGVYEVVATLSLPVRCQTPSAGVMDSTRGASETEVTVNPRRKLRLSVYPALPPNNFKWLVL